VANARALLNVNDQPAKTFEVVYSCQSSSKWQLHFDDYYYYYYYYYYYKLVDVLLSSTRVIDSVYTTTLKSNWRTPKGEQIHKTKGA
jgi:hypothetical protein